MRDKAEISTEVRSPFQLDLHHLTATYINHSREATKRNWYCLISKPIEKFTHCYVSITGHWTYLFFLSYLPLSWSIITCRLHRTALLLFFLSLITPISDWPLYYLVALCLSPYQCLSSYHVQYIGSQSSGTVGLGLCPLSPCHLICSSPPAVYKMYHYSTWTLSLSFRTIETSEPESKELHKLVNFPVSLLSAAA